MAGGGEQGAWGEVTPRKLSVTQWLRRIKIEEPSFAA